MMEMTNEAKPKHMVHWFRRGLRLHDNPSLREGLAGSETFRCIFVLDPRFRGTSDAGINKWRFLLDCLHDLDNNLKTLNSRLFVIRGQPTDVFPDLFKMWGITCLSYEEDPEPYTRVRDGYIKSICDDLGINIISHTSHTLYKLDEIIEKNSGKIPLTYQQFLNAIKKMAVPELPVNPIMLYDVCDSYSPINKSHNEIYNIPTIEELGFNGNVLSPMIWKGGETEALKRLKKYLEKKSQVSNTNRPAMNAESLLASPTGLGPYLRFGCLSVRSFYNEMNKLYKKLKNANPPLSFHGQLLWREFFYCIATRNIHFDQMKDNPICVQIPWDKNSEALAKWANGQTGFPWIDAIMTQLREEGWIHLLARQAVVCFLTRGDLWISWEDGMKVFDEFLLDSDWALNAGMWMWLSCSSLFREFFHCYCPIKFARNTDPHGHYIRKYLPVLKNIPTEYIHEPWNTPLEIQQNAKCIIGVQYPLPIVNHKIVSQINIARMRQIYQHLAQFANTAE